MLTLVKRLALFAFLVVLPLQGLAAVTAPVMCIAGADHHHALDARGAGDSEHHSTGHQHGDSDSGSTSDVAGHLECHHGFSGAAASLLPVSTPDLPILQTTILSAATLYIPELPQRPPRR